MKNVLCFKYLVLQTIQESWIKTCLESMTIADDGHEQTWGRSFPEVAGLGLLNGCPVHKVVHGNLLDTKQQHFVRQVWADGCRELKNKAVSISVALCPFSYNLISLLKRFICLVKGFVSRFIWGCWVFVSCTIKLDLFERSRQYSSLKHTWRFSSTIWDMTWDFYHCTNTGM